jgi:3,4-dihydroxy 2-butanone 4-phosphate synthase/GTP cyclohydrolase II
MHYNDTLLRVEKAILALKSGKSIIVVDDESRENEGDLIFPTELANKNNVNLMLQHGSGIICLSMTLSHMLKLKLEPMVHRDHNTSQFHTPFTVSIDAKKSITTGISAADRAHTIRIAGNPDASFEDISVPGHVFPLVSNEYGVLGRQGHTEASVDIVRLAGFYPTASLCELMNKDGSTMKGREIEIFARVYDLPIISIEDIYRYRLSSEVIIKKVVTTTIPFKHRGKMDMSVFTYPVTQEEVTVVTNKISKNPLIRLHSSCMTGDLFGSLKCDCQSQLNHALDKISEEGGLFIYLNQEGRNIGLANKLKAYELQRMKGLNTIEANQALDLPVDARSYDIAIQILKFWDIQKCQLISNNPNKVKALEDCGISVTTRESYSEVHEWNRSYLQTKKHQCKHNIKGVE